MESPSRIRLQSPRLTLTSLLVLQGSGFHLRRWHVAFLYSCWTSVFSISNWAARLCHRPNHQLWATRACRYETMPQVYPFGISTTVAPGVLQDPRVPPSSFERKHHVVFNL